VWDRFAPEAAAMGWISSRIGWSGIAHKRGAFSVRGGEIQAHVS